MWLSPQVVHRLVSRLNVQKFCVGVRNKEGVVKNIEFFASAAAYCNSMQLLLQAACCWLITRFNGLLANPVVI